MKRRETIETFRFWFEMIDQGWDERKGLYVPEDAGSAVSFNASMVPCLAVMGLEGDSRRARRIPRIIERLVASPPWDPEYHYWNQLFDRLGMEPHAGNFGVGSYIAMVYQHAGDLGIPRELLDKAMDQTELLTAKMAEAARRASQVPFNCYLDEAGNVVDAGAIKRDAIRRGVPEDMRWLREGGPSNQLAELFVASMAFMATGREAFWDHARTIWGRIIEKVENGAPQLYRACMDPDYSFVYAMDPKGGVHTHRYTQSVYASAFLILHADVVRIARKVGRVEPSWEELIRRYSQALFGRALLLDGSSNLVLNGYGWERSITANYVRACYLQPLITLADLTPFTPGQLVHMIDTSLRTLRCWRERGLAGAFPPVLGLKGYHRAGMGTMAQYLTSHLAETILTNEEAMNVEEDPVGFRSCYSGFAWEQKYFVMQTPYYSLTVVGTGTPHLEQNGYLGHGMVVTGGEFALKIADGPFLTPLSDFGRTSLSVQVGGERICSRDVHFFNRGDYRFRMAVILPDGTTIDRGQDFGPTPYDPTLDKLGVEVAFEKHGLRLTRRFDLTSATLTVTDALEALADVEVEDCFSRLPLITVDPFGGCASIHAAAQGRGVEIRPPCHMGYAGDVQHYDQDFVQSLANLERLAVRYPSAYGFDFERMGDGPVRIAITRGEWQENRLMRVDGKNLDYHWIPELTRLPRGARRSFSYRVIPIGPGQNAAA